MHRHPGRNTDPEVSFRPRGNKLSRFMLVVIPLLLLGGYLADIGFPRIFSFASELSSVVAAIIIIVVVVRRGLVAIHPVYWILFLLIGLHLLFGIFVNDVQVGTVIISSRTYLRAIPFFILPLVFLPREKELGQQLVAIVILGCIQLPMALQQRMSTMAVGGYTGDRTIGTLLNSGMLSVFLVCLSCTTKTGGWHRCIPDKRRSPRKVPEKRCRGWHSRGRRTCR